MRRFFYVLSTWLLISCKSINHQPESGSDLRQFFEQATRRDATSDEAAMVAKVRGCASFFVEGKDASRIFMVSARHCFPDYSITDWCRTGTISDNFGNEGRCLRIVVADSERDIALFEAQFGNVRRNPLRLASYIPAKQSRLVMIGYPTDDDPIDGGRKGKLTVTENCWVLDLYRPSPHRHREGIRRTTDESALHNCSTYGGNSGGPMLVEGTKDVIGLPYTYIPKDYVRRKQESLDSAAHLALMGDFVTKHRAAIQAAGVVIADASPHKDESAEILTRQAALFQLKEEPANDAIEKPGNPKIALYRAEVFERSKQKISIDVVLRESGEVTFETLNVNAFTRIQLFDARGKLLGNDEASGLGLNARLAKDLAAGRYRLDVEAAVISHPPQLIPIIATRRLPGKLIALSVMQFSDENRTFNTTFSTMHRRNHVIQTIPLRYADPQIMTRVVTLNDEGQVLGEDMGGGFGLHGLVDLTLDAGSYNVEIYNPVKERNATPSPFILLVTENRE